MSAASLWRIARSSLLQQRLRRDLHALDVSLWLVRRRPDLGLSAYRDDGTTTLGPREALRALQSALWGAELLAKPRRLLNRDQLSGLVGKRDGIIYRAHEITEDELAEGLRAVRSFIVTHGADLATLDILQSPSEEQGAVLPPMRIGLNTVEQIVRSREIGILILLST